MSAAAARRQAAAAVVVLGRLGSATSSPPALGERKESEAAIGGSLSFSIVQRGVSWCRGWPCSRGDGGAGGGVLSPHCTVGRLVGLQSAWPAS